jgi:outer membrane usher protein
VHWVMPEKRQVVLSSTRASSSGDATAQVSWARRVPAAGGQIGTGATLGATLDTQRAAASADFTGQRVTASLSQDTVLTAGNSLQTTTATLGTAVVFADGQLAWSRPVDGSFVIVAPNEALRGQEVEINPSASGALARSNSWGPGVVPGLQPYTATALTLDAPNLPVGLSLGEPIRWVLPTYQSGALVRFGEDGTVSVRGTLVGEDGQPVALMAGIVTSLDDDRPDTMFFTNRTGRFALDAMRSGRYAIQLAAAGAAPIPLEIPARMTGSLDTGILRAASTSPGHGR